MCVSPNIVVTYSDIAYSKNSTSHSEKLRRIKVEIKMNERGVERETNENGKN
jgi:hypothetical protein